MIFPYAMLPNKFEAGTPPIEAVVGFSAAIDYVKSINFKSFFDKERNLRSDLIKALNDTCDIEIYGSDPSLDASSIVSFNLPGHNYNDIATFLDQYGIMIRGWSSLLSAFYEKIRHPWFL
jgi:cysteine desulfurase/selenocysteine lyase